MEFFVRRYVKGTKGSGTEDILVSDYLIPLEEFHQVCDVSGPGKYLLCIRGAGIRGFKKMDDYVVREPPLIFDAETISVKQNIDVSEMSHNELLELMGGMINNSEGTGVPNEKFMSDLKTFHSELSSRANDTATPSDSFNSDTLVSAGFPVGTSITSFVLGALSGGILVWVIQKNTIDDLKSQISTLENSVKSAEEAINSVKKKAEQIERNQNIPIDQIFMHNYNRATGYNP